MVDLGIEHVADAALVGRGGFSAVYSARHTLLQRAVAVKVLNRLSGDGDRAGFERECEVMGRMSGHDHVVGVYHAGFSHEEKPFIIMELVSGGTLADLLARRGPLPWKEAIGYVLPICHALGAAHDQQILHRDVKPENVLLDGDVPKLADFGIARLRDATGATSTHITASWLHTAPETFENKRDERSDLYSLASTLYELVTGHAPFWRADDESLSPLMMRLVKDPPPNLGAGEGPPALDQFFQVALAKNPDDRPQSAAEMARQLEHLVATGLFPPPGDGSAAKPQATTIAPTGGGGSGAPDAAPSPLAKPVAAQPVPAAAARSLSAPVFTPPTPATGQAVGGSTPLIGGAGAPTTSHPAPAPAPASRSAIWAAIATVAVGGVALAALVATQGTSDDDDLTTATTAPVEVASDEPAGDTGENGDGNLVEVDQAAAPSAALDPICEDARVVEMGEAPVGKADFVELTANTCYRWTISNRRGEEIIGKGFSNDGQDVALALQNEVGEVVLYEDENRPAQFQEEFDPGLRLNSNETYRIVLVALEGGGIDPTGGLFFDVRP